MLKGFCVRVSNNLATCPGCSPASARRHLGLTLATHATMSEGASLIENGCLSAMVLYSLRAKKQNNEIFTGKKKLDTVLPVVESLEIFSQLFAKQLFSPPDIVFTTDTEVLHRCCVLPVLVLY